MHHVRVCGWCLLRHTTPHHGFRLFSTWPGKMPRACSLHFTAATCCMKLPRSTASARSPPPLMSTLALQPKPPRVRRLITTQPVQPRAHLAILASPWTTKDRHGGVTAAAVAAGAGGGTLVLWRRPQAKDPGKSSDVSACPLTTPHCCVACKHQPVSPASTLLYTMASACNLFCDVLITHEGI